MKCEFCGRVYDETEAADTCGGCPLRRQCGKTRCPSCGREEVKTPRWLRWLMRAESRPASTGCGECTLAALTPGSEGTISGLDGADLRTVRKLLAMGLTPGTTVRVVRSWSGVVLRVGYGEIALDRDTAHKVGVTRVSL